MVNNGAILMQVMAMISLRDRDHGLGLEDYKQIAPLLILIFFSVYPIVTYCYLSHHLDWLNNILNETFRHKHRAVFAGLRYYRKRRMGLGYILFIHYRKLAFSFVIVVLKDHPA